MKINANDSLRLIPVLEQVLKQMMDVTDVEIIIHVNDEQLNGGLANESIHEGAEEGVDDSQAGSG